MNSSFGCADCPLGKFGSSTPLSDCANCSEGRWSYYEGATSCASSPTVSPSDQPSTSPSSSPNNSPSKSPTPSPSDKPSTSPSRSPSASPSLLPSTLPSESPSLSPSVSPSHVPTLNSSSISQGISPAESMERTFLTILSSPYLIGISSGIVVCVGIRVYLINKEIASDSKNSLGKTSPFGLGISCLDFWTDVKFIILVSTQPQFSGLFRLSLFSLLLVLIMGIGVIIYVLRWDSRILDEDRFRKHNFFYCLVIVIAFTQVEALVLLPWAYPPDQRYMRGFPSAKSMYLCSLSVFVENIPQIFIQTSYLWNGGNFSLFVALSLMLSLISLVMKIVRLTVFRFLESLPKGHFTSNVKEGAQKTTVDDEGVQKAAVDDGAQKITVDNVL